MNGVNSPRRNTAAIVLLLAVLVTFAPLFAAEFTSYDDLNTIARNPHLNPPSLAVMIR